MFVSYAVTRLADVLVERPVTLAALHPPGLVSVMAQVGGALRLQRC